MSTNYTTAYAKSELMQNENKVLVEKKLWVHFLGNHDKMQKILLKSLRIIQSCEKMRRRKKVACARVLAFKAESA